MSPKYSPDFSPTCSILCKKWTGFPSMTIKRAKLNLFKLKEKDKVTSPLLQDSYQEDMEVPEAAKKILSEDFEDSLQKNRR